MPRETVSRARSVLGRFRQASLLAIVITALLLMLTGGASDVSALEPTADADGATEQVDELPRPKRASDVAKATGDEAERTVATLRTSFIGNLPKIALVAGLLAAAWIFVRVLRAILKRALGDWSRTTAVNAIAGVSIWVLTIALAVSILAGDIRAFVGSVGLLGLALSWALQTPIESFTGWLLNAFKGYYRIGDRVEVGEVFGDVHRIDVLTTTVWEIGSPFRASFVHAEQPTGRLITFPNNQILTGSVMNYTRDFAYVWDELNVPVANESDLPYARDLLARISTELLGDEMEGPAGEYERILRRANLEGSVARGPEVFVSFDESWTSLTIRYLVEARKRRKCKSDLVMRIASEVARPEHGGRILPVLPRRQIQMIGRDGAPRDATWFDEDDLGTADAADLPHGHRT